MDIFSFVKSTWSVCVSCQCLAQPMKSLPQLSSSPAFYDSHFHHIPLTPHPRRASQLDMKLTCYPSIIPYCSVYTSSINDMVQSDQLLAFPRRKHNTDQPVAVSHRLHLTHPLLGIPLSHFYLVNICPFHRFMQKNRRILLSNGRKSFPHLHLYSTVSLSPLYYYILIICPISPS